MSWEKAGHKRDFLMVRCLWSCRPGFDYELGQTIDFKIDNAERQAGKL